MIDREKVIYSIERCICHVPDACRDCAYDAGHPYNECVEMMLKDILTLLKEQEPVKPNKPGTAYKTTWSCGVCSYPISTAWVACPSCGRKVKWND